jgi:hypothetical protein
MGNKKADGNPSAFSTKAKSRPVPCHRKAQAISFHDADCGIHTANIARAIVLCTA